MVALQRLEKVLIRATDFTGATIANLHGVTLDVAIPRKQPGDSRPTAVGIEQCKCPLQYNGTSCQDPGRGFYRWYSEFMTTTTTYLHLAGDVKPCQCNGRAQNCHPESGHCVGCTENTTGAACELCAAGYYGNPLLAGGSCQPCQCPSAENNHAATCRRDGPDNFLCQCKEGYTGPACDRCDYGFYGNSEDGCLPCRCNPDGSIGNQCHQESGQCICAPGVSGRDCSQCPLRQVGSFFSYVKDYLVIGCHFSAHLNLFYRSSCPTGNLIVAIATFLAWPLCLTIWMLFVNFTTMPTSLISTQRQCSEWSSTKNSCRRSMQP